MTGESNVWKIASDASWAECGEIPEYKKLFHGGFTSIIDLRFDEDDTLHVVEFDKKNWLAVEPGFPERTPYPIPSTSAAAGNGARPGPA